jgi:DNA-binding XRE family transcriptional regulator
VPDIEIVTLRVTGNRIRRRLDLLAMSQEECARRADISTRTLHRAMHGPRPPLLETCLRIALILGTTVEDLFVVQKSTRPAR